MSDRPVYLHFLDRELGESVQYSIDAGVAESVLRVLLVGTSSWLYAGLSLLWESPAASEEFRAFAVLLADSGAFGVVTSHPTVDDFLASRQRLYVHDAARYPMYFRGTGARNLLKPTDVLESRTTETLAGRFAQRAATNQLAQGVEPEAGKKVIRAVGQAMIERDGRAVTYELFHPYLQERGAGAEAGGWLRREVSREYTRRYMEVAGGDITTGIVQLQAFDDLATTFPRYDYPILSALLATTSLSRVLSESWRRNESIWSVVGEWRPSPPYRALQTQLSMLLHGLMAGSASPSNGSATRSSARHAAITAVKGWAYAQARSGGGATKADDLAFEGLRTLTVLAEHLSRDRGFARVYDEARMVAGQDRCDVLLITATPIEQAAVLRAFTSTDQPLLYIHGRRSYVDLGEVAGAKVFLVQGGMGSATPGGSLATVGAALDDVRPWAVIMVGIAFGVDETEQRIGDVLVAERVYGYEPQRVGTSITGDTEIRPRGSKWPASPTLLSRFRTGCLDWTHAPVHFGTLLSGEKLVDNVAFRLELQGYAADAIGGEMEGTGLFAAALEKGVDWLVVKAKCDWADGNKGSDKDERQRAAAASAASLLFHVLSNGGFRQRDDA